MNVSLSQDTLLFPSEIAFEGLTEQLEMPNNQSKIVQSCQYPTESFDQTNAMNVELETCELFSSKNMENKYQFSIREVSPEWAYSSESTKVRVIQTYHFPLSNNE